VAFSYAPCDHPQQQVTLLPGQKSESSSREPRHRDPLVPHWGTVKRVQTRLGFRGRGIGTAR
jgi:hypothetical protein